MLALGYLLAGGTVAGGTSTPPVKFAMESWTGELLAFMKIQTASPNVRVRTLLYLLVEHTGIGVI